MSAHTRWSRWTPGCVAVFVTLLALSGLYQPARGPFDTRGFGSLPVLESGRVKPLDSVARNALMALQGKQSVKGPEGSMGADAWILETLFRPRQAAKLPVFLIDDPEVLGLVGITDSTQRRFSFEALMPHLQEIARQAEPAMDLNARSRSRFQQAIVRLYEQLALYHRLMYAIEAPGMSLADELQANTLPARMNPEAIRRREALIQMAAFKPLPPLPGVSPEWRSVGEGLQAGSPHPVLPLLAILGGAYRLGDAATFNRTVGEIQAGLRAVTPAASRHARHEAIFNRAQPFYAGMMLYVAAILAFFVSRLWKREILQPTAFALLFAGVLIHSLGLIARIALQGRPPVTNLYSSAVFVGWGAAALGLMLDGPMPSRTKRAGRGFGTLVGAVAGFASLLIAHHLAHSGETMEMMRAVLDSNFWLTTHVLTITLGYSAMFLAGTLGAVYAIRRHLGRPMEPAAEADLGSKVYGVVCFALCFSFIGTALGGIWADQSWGRFWGWDPKENGALLIVLWTAILLHARWAGYAKTRGVMAMAIFGNIVTAFSWFGVNMLGVGLHAYGFTASAFRMLALFGASQAVLIGLCLWPTRPRDAAIRGAAQGLADSQRTSSTEE